MLRTCDRRSMMRPPQKPPNARPAIKEANTVLTAKTVSPNNKLSRRVQAISYIKALMPETKKSPTTTWHQPLAGGKVCALIFPTGIDGIPHAEETRVVRGLS